MCVSSFANLSFLPPPPFLLPSSHQSGDEDVSQFDSKFTKLTPIDSPPVESKISDSANLNFQVSQNSSSITTLLKVSLLTLSTTLLEACIKHTVEIQQPLLQYSLYTTKSIYIIYSFDATLLIS